MDFKILMASLNTMHKSTDHNLIATFAIFLRERAVHCSGTLSGTAFTLYLEPFPYPDRWFQIKIASSDWNSNSKDKLILEKKFEI